MSSPGKPTCRRFGGGLLTMCLAANALLFADTSMAAEFEVQPLPGKKVIDHLGAPRGLSFDRAGHLLIADAGTGGSTKLVFTKPDGKRVEQYAGLSGRIVSVGPSGVAADLITGYPSYSNGKEPGGGNVSEVVGVYRIIPRGKSLWLLFSGEGDGATGAFWRDCIVEYDRATLAVKTVINLNGIELTKDPDGRGYDSNVTDIDWAPDGTMYIANAGQNTLLSWKEKGGLKLVHVWPDDPVPTCLEVAPNGDLYIGFLGTGMAPGAGRIEHWSGDSLVETFSGLSQITDILLDGETLYAVELAIPGAKGPGPGNVITVSSKGNRIVAEGLTTPFGICKGPDGAYYVSYGTIQVAPGVTGGVVKLEPKNVLERAPYVIPPVEPVKPTEISSRGERIFRIGTGGAPPCITCHQVDVGSVAIPVGPSLIGISKRAASAVPGLTAQQYLEQSILRPTDHIVPGYQPVMFPGYAKLLSEADVAEVIKFLMTR